MEGAIGMKAKTVLLVACGLVLMSLAGAAYGHNVGKTAYAIPLEGITIDGKLDDWPEGMIQYPILNQGQAYGPTDIDGADLTTSPDLSPSFRVGFSSEENRIYLAVRVRDDLLVVSTADPWHTDACEVYVDGAHRGERFMSSEPEVSAGDLPALQYVLCPPGGSYGEVPGSADPSANPNIAMGDIGKTRTEGAVTRERDVTIYEWAIEAFDHYPDAPTTLVAGKTIGFEVVTVDKDSETDSPAWICWAPFGADKLFDAGRLGDLVLVESEEALGAILGRVMDQHGGASGAQQFDLLIDNGHVIDPKNGVNGTMDVAIAEGKIVQVAEEIPSEGAKKRVDADGLYVTPGLIDIHAHVFWGTKKGGAYFPLPEKGDIWWGYSNSYGSVPPDAFSFRSGVTTMVDAGGAGWRNIREFREQTVRYSHTRVLAFLNIVGSGMYGGPAEHDLNDMDAKLTAYAAQLHSDIVVGIKLAHYYGPEWEPTDRAVEAGRQVGIPAMIDFGNSTPELSLEELFLEHLRPGDIFTHCYADVYGRMAVMDENGDVQPFVFEAQKKGIVFDVGHGAGSFLFRQAMPAMEQGFSPNTISTDLHAMSMNAGMKDITNIMSKFLTMGMSLEEVIDCATWRAARVIQREELGHLSPGAEADVAVLNLREGNFGFVDSEGGKLMGTRKLEAELTLRAGEVMWDLNGMLCELWSD